MKEATQKRTNHIARHKERHQKREKDYAKRRSGLESRLEQAKDEAKRAAEVLEKHMAHKENVEQDLAKMLGEAEVTHKTKLANEMKIKKEKTVKLQEASYKAEVKMNRTRHENNERKQKMDALKGSIDLDNSLQRQMMPAGMTGDTQLEGLEFYSASDCEYYHDKKVSGQSLLKALQDSSIEVPQLVAQLPQDEASTEVKHALSNFANVVEHLQDAVEARAEMGKYVAVLTAARVVLDHHPEAQAQGVQVFELRKAAEAVLGIGQEISHAQRECTGSKTKIMAYKLGAMLNSSKHEELKPSVHKAVSGVLATIRGMEAQDLTQLSERKLASIVSTQKHLRATLAAVAATGSEGAQLARDAATNVADWIEIFEKTEKHSAELTRLTPSREAAVKKLMSVMSEEARNSALERQQKAKERIELMMNEQAAASKKAVHDEQVQKDRIKQVDEARAKAQAKMQAKIVQDEQQDAQAREIAAKQAAHGDSKSPTAAPASTHQATHEPTVMPTVAPEVTGAVLMKLQLTGVDVDDFDKVEPSLKASVAARLSVPEGNVVMRDAHAAGNATDVDMMIMAWGGLKLVREDMLLALDASSLKQTVIEKSAPDVKPLIAPEGTFKVTAQPDELGVHTLETREAFISHKKDRTVKQYPEEPSRAEVKKWCSDSHGRPYPCSEAQSSVRDQRVQREEAGLSKWAHPQDTSNGRHYPLNRQHERGWSHQKSSDGAVKKWCSDTQGEPIPCDELESTRK
jgi:hypothetical protein